MKQKIKNFWYDIRELLLLLIMLIVVIGGCFGSILPVMYYECKNKAFVMNVNYEWLVIGGCFFEAEEGVFIHEDNYRYAEIEK